MGPLQLSDHVVQNRQTREQMAHSLHTATAIEI